MLSPVDLIRRLGMGKDPTSLDVGSTPDGQVDLRGLRLPNPSTEGTIRTPAGTVAYTSGKIVFRKIRLCNVDLSGSTLKDTIWHDVDFRDVKFDSSDLQGSSFGSGTLERVSFRHSNLRGSGWGFYGKAGPLVLDSDFSLANMSPATFAHPLFRRCNFDNTRLDRVDFAGSRFEDCKFVGLLVDVWFREQFKDPNRRVAKLRNEMKSIDFSACELILVNFEDVDLKTCRLPLEGHLVVPYPRRVFLKALENVEGKWNGVAKEKASYFLAGTVRDLFHKDVPLYVFRPQDLAETALGRAIATRVVDEIRNAIGQLGLADPQSGRGIASSRKSNA